MDLRAIVTQMVTEAVRSAGDDLSESDIAEVVRAYFLPPCERRAEILRLDGGRKSARWVAWIDYQIRAAERDVRPERGRNPSVRWSGVPRAYRYVDLPNGKERKAGAITVPSSDLGAVPFMRADSPGTWAARLRECVRKRIAGERAQAANKSRKAHGGGRKRSYFSRGGTYHT